MLLLSVYFVDYCSKKELLILLLLSVDVVDLEQVDTVVSKENGHYHGMPWSTHVRANPIVGSLRAPHQFPCPATTWDNVLVCFTLPSNVAIRPQLLHRLVLSETHYY